jgi:TolA-binding protein
MHMKLRIAGAALSLVAMMSAAPAAAANKEHQQMMADIRMLQEQQQALQNLLAQMTEALKAVNTRLDQQSETLRKGLADTKLVVDNLSNDARVIREKLDDNNVRVGTLSQEVEALRQGLQQISRPAPTTTSPDPADPGAAGAAPPAAPAAAPNLSDSPLKMYNAAQADYMAGQYDLAIIGFTEFIKQYPRSELADDAQVAMCAAYTLANKPLDAANACDLAIRTYPTSDKLPEAYWRKGLALSNLKNVNGAREAWEFVVKNFPNSPMADLARNGLEKLRRP